MRMHAEKVYDRRATELPTNSIVAAVIVDDPYSVVGEKLTVLRSLRDDPLAGMLSRRQIDDAQFMAGRKWQEYAEMSEVGGVQAVDTTKEPVDGGGAFREPITDRQVEAFKSMADISALLGPVASRLVLEILGFRASIRQAAESRGRFTKWGLEKTGREFREALEKMAVFLGYAQAKA